MKLIGRWMSPYTRRVAITLKLYGMAFDHEPLTLMDPEHASEIGRHNPLGRVPVLIMDDGTRLIESWAILDTLDDMVGPEKALTPATGKDRRDVMQLLGLQVGVLERAMLAFYERTRRPDDKRWKENEEKLRSLAVAALSELDRRLKDAGGEWYVGGAMTQADVTGTVVWDFLGVTHPDLQDPARFPAIFAQAERLDRQEAFASTHPDAK